MSPLQIRRASFGDEEEIARVHIQSWQEAYRDLISSDYLAGLSEQLSERVEVWRRILRNPKRWAWVALVDGKIVGFCLFGPPRDENRESYVELGAIYLLAKHKSQGIGFALLSSGFDFMKFQGYKKAYCWVLEGNPTIQFYEKSGAFFSKETKSEETGGQMLLELAYEWDLSKNYLTGPYS